MEYLYRTHSSRHVSWHGTVLLYATKNMLITKSDPLTGFSVFNVRRKLGSCSGARIIGQPILTIQHDCCMCACVRLYVRVCVRACVRAPMRDISFRHFIIHRTYAHN